jgi:hypothetical protein
MSDDELPVTYRHNDKSGVDVAVHNGQDIATIEATDSGALVAYGERTREFESIEAAKIWIAEHADDLGGGGDPDGREFLFQPNVD